MPGGARCGEEGGKDTGDYHLFALCQLLDADVLHVPLSIEIAELEPSWQLEEIK